MNFYPTPDAKFTNSTFAYGSKKLNFSSFTHSLSGNKDHYLVDVQYDQNEAGGGISEIPLHASNEDIVWHNLTDNSINLNDVHSPAVNIKVRVRIWDTSLASSGGSNGGSGWVDVPLSDTNPFDQQCMYRFVMQGQTYYAETVHEDRLYWINVMYFAKANKSVLFGGIAPFTVATKMEKLCGGGGSSGGGPALYKCTNAQSLDVTNAPCYGASRNGGAGTNQYRVVSCSNTDASGTYTAGGLLNFGDFIANKWSFHINNSNIACIDGTVLVMDIQGGGSGSTSATCPTGFVAVGSFCIEPTMNATNKDWYEAALACTEKGAQLCHWSEWSAACQKGVLTDVVFGASGKYEWIDDYSIANQGIADPIVYSNCKYLSRQADGTKAANTAYRCCAPKQ